MSRLTRDQGLVLAAKDAAETDRIVTVLTLGHGKIPILAKGAWLDKGCQDDSETGHPRGAGGHFVVAPAGEMEVLLAARACLVTAI